MSIAATLLALRRFPFRRTSHGTPTEHPLDAYHQAHHQSLGDPYRRTEASKARRLAQLSPSRCTCSTAPSEWCPVHGPWMREY